MRATIYLLITVFLFSSFYSFVKEDHPSTRLLLDGIVIYVNSDATGNDNGTSWDDAYEDLQSALAVAQAGDSIWVASNVYLPTTAADRSASFLIPDAVAIFGGFVGMETILAERNWIANPTILSGDIGVAGDNTDNSLHVLTGQNLASNALLDGFVIENGNANGGDSPGPEQFGGALYLSESELMVRNCHFRNNHAQFRGGAVFFESSLPRMQNCTFEDNSCSQDGGAVFVQYATENTSNTANFQDCDFSRNQALQGGAVKIFATNSLASFPLFFQACTFAENGLFESGVMTEGGAVFNQTGESHRFEACTFTENFANRGGAVRNRYPEGVVRAGFYSCRFEGNYTSITGSSIGGAVADGATGPAETNYISCLFYNNQSDHGGGFYYSFNPVSPRLINCVFDSNQGGGAFLDCANAYFGNCTFYNNHLPGIATLSCSAPIIENCIFWDNTFSNLGSFNSNPIFRHCLAPGEDCDALDYAQCEGVIFGQDPLFIEPDSGDFRLMICSPARNAGDNDLLPMDIDTDASGNLRIIEEQIDIGAHEFHDQEPQYRLTDVTRSDDNRQPRTLRSSMICANLLPGPDTILFFPAEGESFLIQPKIPLPELLADSTVIDASTQPLGTVIVDGSIVEEISGSLAYGAMYIRGKGMEIYGLDIRNWPRSGIYLQGFSSNARIGAPGKGNSILNNFSSAGFANIFLGGNDHIVQSNYIGVSQQEEVQLIANAGIALSVSPPILRNALIGGKQTLGEGNIFGGCSTGIGSSDLINNEDPFVNIQVKGNYFGTNPSGEAVFPNGRNIIINSGQPWEDACIGGSLEEANVFAHSEEIAIRVGNNSQRVYISRNSFYCNEQAIVLEANTNGNIQPPVIDTADVTYIAGTAAPGDSVQVFASDTTGCLTVSACQGKTYLGTVIADEEGHWSLDSFLAPLTGDEEATALVIDSTRNTSAFANCLPVLCPVSFGSVELTLCADESIIVNGVVYDTDNPQGVETFEGANVLGCDSIVTIELHFLELSATTLDLAVCESESVMVGDMIFAEAGQYEILLTNSNGCDSLVTLNLEVHPTPLVDLGEDINIGPGESYPLDPQTNIEVQSYQWSTGDTTQQIVVNTGGTYSVTIYDSNGCSASDEIVVMVVSKTDEERREAWFDIVPNPASGNAWISFSEQIVFPVEIGIYNVKGQMLQQQQLERHPGSTLAINLVDFYPGVYIVQLRGETGARVKKLVVH